MIVPGEALTEAVHPQGGPAAEAARRRCAGGQGCPAQSRQGDERRLRGGLPRLQLRFSIERASSGYRRITALVNRQLASEGWPRVEPQAGLLGMKAAGLLLTRHTGNPTSTHEGTVATLKSNPRWCADAFEIRCRNEARVQVAFSLACCDREAMRFVATTGGLTGERARDLMAETLEHRVCAGRRRARHTIELLTDNGPAYTAHEPREFGSSLGLLPRKQRHGGVLREELHARLRVAGPLGHRRGGPPAAPRLVRRRQHRALAQCAEDALPEGVSAR